jgi:predicted nucleic acid-binding protein
MNFADTGAFLALYHRRDQHNKEAVRLWPMLERPVLTSNHVIAELAKLLARRAGYRVAVDSLVEIYASPTFQILASTRDDEIAALLWMRKFADQRVSFTDCVSFALMRRYRIRTAFTFDRHFRLAGFEVLGLK